jgi:hypothetical protein
VSERQQTQRRRRSPREQLLALSFGTLMRGSLVECLLAPADERGRE